MNLIQQRLDENCKSIANCINGCDPYLEIDRQDCISCRGFKAEKQGILLKVREELEWLILFSQELDIAKANDGIKLLVHNRIKLLEECLK